MPRLTREQARQQTRERLKDAASRLIERFGSAGFGIEQIAREAGYTRGAFYSNYADRLAILLEILQDRRTSEILHWRDALARIGEAAPDDGLADVVQAAQRLGKPWLRIDLELHLEAERNAGLRPAFIAYVEAIHAAIRPLMVELLERNGKAPPDDLDLRIAGLRALGMMTALASLFAFADDAEARALRLTRDYARSIVRDAPARSRPADQPPSRA